jgi:hypothetical protein
MSRGVEEKSEATTDGIPKSLMLKEQISRKLFEF